MILKLWALISIEIQVRYLKFYCDIFSFKDAKNSSQKKFNESRESRQKVSDLNAQFEDQKKVKDGMEGDA